MEKTLFNPIFPFLKTLSEGEKAFVFTFSIIVFMVCIITAVSILPEHCSLFSNNIESGFACDGLDWRNPQPCVICRDKGTAKAASIIAGLGFSFFLIPFAVLTLKDFLSRPTNKVKLFE
jgi:hypothetical protein